MRQHIVFLGPPKSTFSYFAYERLSAVFKGVPAFADAGVLPVPVGSNKEILPVLLARGGYGVIAMETKSDGRVAEPVESFIDLVDRECGASLRVIGAVRMPLRFALMARPGVRLDEIKTVLAHPKAFDPCRRRIAALGAKTELRGSNGIAAENVAADDAYRSCAALAPAGAAKEYGLAVLDESFADGEAITTFFLLSTRNRAPVVLERNRALLVFRTEDRPGALVDALSPFRDHRLNLIHVHSAYADGRYAFAVEIEFTKRAIGDFHRALRRCELAVSRLLHFGPFGIV